MAAALVPNDVQAEARAQMSGLRRSGRTKAHWHDARTRSEKRTLVDAVVEIPIRTLVVVRVDDPDMRIERRRRLCLERLLFELQQRGIAEVVAESRGPGDRHDLDHLQALRSQKQVTTELRLRDLPGPVEPLEPASGTISTSGSWRRQSTSSNAERETPGPALRDLPGFTSRSHLDELARTILSQAVAGQQCVRRALWICARGRRPVRCCLAGATVPSAEPASHGDGWACRGGRPSRRA